MSHDRGSSRNFAMLVGIMQRYLASHPRRKSALGVGAGLVLLSGLLLAVHPVRREIRVAGQTAQAHLSRPATAPFPNVDSKGLNPTQQRIVAISRQEYAKHPVSYDARVLTYTQGSEEAWCADFASWVMLQAGVPLSNPNSGSWRIPGVYTLKEYFESKHGFQPVGTYRPKPGDIAIYSHGQGHAAIVLTVHGSSITTIGGNETGRLRIDTRPQTGGNSYDLIGYGVLGL